MSDEMRLAAIAVPGEVEAWVNLGFNVDDAAIALANGAVVPGADGPTLVIDGLIDRGDVDGVSMRPGLSVPGSSHVNTAFEIDHLVLMTNSIERTSAEVDSMLGLEQRRVRETPKVRQAFHRFPDQGGSRGCIIELVERPDVEMTSLWGLVVNVGNLDVFCAEAGDLVGLPKPAVQPGRRIATVRREAGLGVAVAVMSTD